jgi:hypothetical protein
MTITTAMMEARMRTSWNRASHSLALERAIHPMIRRDCHGGYNMSVGFAPLAWAKSLRD